MQPPHTASGTPEPTTPHIAWVTRRYAHEIPVVAAGCDTVWPPASLCRHSPLTARKQPAHATFHMLDATVSSTGSSISTVSPPRTWRVVYKPLPLEVWTRTSKHTAGCAPEAAMVACSGLHGIARRAQACSQGRLSQPSPRDLITRAHLRHAFNDFPVRHRCKA